MNVETAIMPPHELDVEVLVAILFEGEAPNASPELEALDERSGGLIGSLIASGEFRGKAYETAYIHTPGRIAARRLLLIGAGKGDKPLSEIIRNTAGTAARLVQSKQARSMAFVCRSAWELDKAAQAATEGVLLGIFDVGSYRTQDKESRFFDQLIVGAATGSLSALERGVERGKILAKATNFARHLTNEPSSEVTPSELAAQATAMAERFGLDVEVLDEQQMRDQGMGAILGVARGSDEPAKLIVIRYTPEGDHRAGELLAVVGKGITFDTGGISLKPAENMEKMKYDMAGGAAVLGAMRALGQLRPRIPVIGIVPATENMPSGRAQKPGDVLRSLSGKTIEVINTDAEGRLILADAITYAQQLGATRLVDLATLTGAVTVALGSVYAAILGNDEQWVAEVIAAGKEAGERYWPLPLDEAYREQLKSDIADIKNIGGRKAGAITAAQFIQEFVGEIPWAHLDIAGTAWLDEKKPYIASGPTGIGVRTLVYLAERLLTR